MQCFFKIFDLNDEMLQIIDCETLLHVTIVRLLQFIVIFIEIYEEKFNKYL